MNTQVILVKYDSSKLLGCGSFAKVYNVTEIKSNAHEQPIDRLDKSWLQFSINSSRLCEEMSTILATLSSKQLAVKIGTIHDIEASLARQFPKHPNIVQQFAQNDATCDVSGRFMLLEKIACTCVDMTRDIVGARLAKYLQDIYAGLDYLHGKHQVVYCDLSLANTGVSIDGAFKIFDFGSIKPIGKKCTNPRNTNKLFCSPYFHQTGTIEPCAHDDLTSLWYIFIRQSNIKLPWEYMQLHPSMQEEDIDYIIAFIKMQFFPAITQEQKQYWSIAVPFENFMFNMKPNKK